MKIKLLHDFGGLETNERHFKKDEVVDLPSQMANDLVLLGHAELLEKPAPAPAPEPEPEPAPEPEAAEEFVPRKRGRK